MFGSITKLFTGSRKSSQHPACRKTTFKPGMESLESREVLSASSGSLHAVAPPPGHLTQQIDFYIDARTHLLSENGVALNGTTGSPVGVRTLSAGHDARGGAEVFVTAGDGSFWRWDAGHWSKLLSPTADLVKSYAAVDGDRAYAVLENVRTGGIALDQFDGSSFHKIAVTGTPQRIDAVTDTSNRDVVFVRNTDGSMFDYGQFAPGSGFLSDKLFNGGQFRFNRITSFSAGLDQNGDGEVYATFRDLLGRSSLYKNHEGSSPSGWQFVAPGSSYKAFSATDNGEVWMIGSDGSVFELDAFGHKDPQTELGSFISGAEISAANSKDVFIVSSDGSITQWVDSPIVGWETVGGAGTAQL